MLLLCDTLFEGLVQVDLMNTKTIMESAAGQEVLARGIPMVGESGIFTPEHVKLVHDAGCKAILVGESIVKQGDRERAVKELLA
jgi:indole-3-glycerol phosphate synthase